MKKRFVIIFTSVMSLMTIIPFLSSCKATDTDALSLYDGVVHNSYYANTNRYGIFHTEPTLDEDGLAWGYDLYVSGKTEINTKKVPTFPTIINRCVRRVFATSDYLYLIADDDNSPESKIERVDLSDYSIDVLFEEAQSVEKIVFGLAFSSDRTVKERGLNPYYIFSNDRDVFFLDHDKGIFKVLPDKTAKNIIADKVRYDVAYDGNYFFYITMKGILKQYEIKSGRTEILTDKTVTPYTLKVTKEDITFESDKEKVTIKRKICI
ncbi:MAG: hypothetical protein J6D27_02320 [Ruminiclostridium sp.]|nr:hypothetical protein [Ruminiclostridium sp.]